MGNNKSGVLYQIKDGGKAISYNCEQEHQFVDLNKRYVHFLNDDFTELLNEDGKQKSGLKSLDKLTLIGYTD